MVPAIVLTGLGILTFINYKACHDLRYPPFIMSALWLATLIAYYFAPFSIDRISATTAIIFVVTVMSFTVGGLFSLRGLRPDMKALAKRPHLTRPGSVHPAFRTFLLWISVLLLPVYLWKAIWLAAQSNVYGFFSGLRAEVSLPGSLGYGFIANATVVSFFTTFVYAVEGASARREKIEFRVSLLLSFAYAVFSTGRTAIFLILVVLTGITVMKREMNARKLALVVSVFLLFFGAFATILGKGADPEASWSENLPAIGESLLQYSFGALPAFDEIVQDHAPLRYGRSTFISFRGLVDRFAGREPPSAIEEFTTVPFPTNVYTAIRPVYEDYGILGVIVAFIIIGAASANSYAKATAGSRMHIYCYSILLFPLLLSAFSDQYFAPMLLWLRYLLAGYLYFHTRKVAVHSPKMIPVRRTSPI